MKFVAASINNHIGSDIEMEVGTYDSVAKSFTYAGENELIPGMKNQYRRVLKIIDDNHYVEEYYSKALLALIFTEFKEKKVLKDLDQQTKAILLIGFKSFIQCFEDIIARGKNI